MTVTHCAKYSEAILDTFRPILEAECPHAHDPFAGTGERLGALCDELGVPFSGTELEAPFIVDRRVLQGDSRHLYTYPYPYHALPRSVPQRPFWIVTSPVYANGMADNFKPSGTCSRCKRHPGYVNDDWGSEAPCDPCAGTGRRAVKRYTYRSSLIETTGNPDAELDGANMGRNSYRGGNKARERYWAIAQACMVHWHLAERVVVNVSDFPMGGEMVPHVGEWCLILHSAGFAIDLVHELATPRMRNGANSTLRAPAEAIIVARSLRGR